MTVSDVLRREIHAQESGDTLVALVTIDHATLSEPVRVCSSTAQDLPVAGRKGIVSNGVEYIHYPFEMEPPSDEGGQPLRATLTIDNVDRLLVEEIGNLTSPPTVTIQAVLESQPDVVEVNFENLEILQAKWDVLRVRGDLVQTTIENEMYAGPKMTASDFPALA